MNIKQAKQEIINTVQAYLTKDETGEYAIPVERQRPVLLIGPPGIGKTAIMEQVAQECGIYKRVWSPATASCTEERRIL